MKSRTDQFLGGAATIAAIALGLVLAATILRVAAWPYFIKHGWVASSRAPYAAGDHIDLDAIVYAHSDYTIVLFARSNCGACEAAIPFDQSLVALVAAHPKSRMVLVSPLDRARELPYAHSLGLTDDALVPWPMPAPRVQAAPTIVLIDRTGLILGAWEGSPTDAVRQEIIATITRVLAGGGR